VRAFDELVCWDLLDVLRNFVNACNCIHEVENGEWQVNVPEVLKVIEMFDAFCVERIVIQMDVRHSVRVIRVRRHTVSHLLHHLKFGKMGRWMSERVLVGHLLMIPTGVLLIFAYWVLFLKW
jgi:hypothetical protein